MPLIRKTLQEPPLSGFPVSPVTVMVDAGANGVHGIRLEFSGDHNLWDEVRARGLFHHSDDICGPIFGGQFRLDLPFLFTVELVPSQVAVLAALTIRPEAAHEVLEHAPPESPLRRPESYRLLSVMQQRTPKVHWGLTTTWFRESPG